MFAIISIFSLLSAASAFFSSSSTRGMTTSLSMRVKAPSVGNLPRKLKRKLRSVDAANFLTSICTPEYDTFLKEEATGAIYNNLFKKITETARKLKVSLAADFGKKKVIVLPTIVEAAIAAGTFNTLVTAVKAADLVGTLSGADAFTVLAPNDEAFAKLSPEALNELLADKEKLTATLTFHVLAGRLNSKKLSAEKEVKVDSVNGAQIVVKTSRDGEVTINGAALLAKDIKCSNGIIHVIDTVLIPK